MVGVGGGNVPAVVEIGGGSPAVHQQDGRLKEVNNQPGEPTIRKYRRQIEQAKEKAENRTRLALEARLPMRELIAGVAEDIERFAAELGLTIIQRVMEAEIQQKVGQYPAHKAKQVQAYVQSLAGKLELYFLPPYAPELNPDEFVWGHAKANGVSKKPLRQNESLRQRVESDLEDIKQNKTLVRSFFCAESVAYARDW